MANATKDIQNPAAEVAPWPSKLALPVEAATTIYAGTMVATNAAGNAITASTAGALVVWGKATKQVVNTTAAGFGAAGALTIEAELAYHYLDNDTTNPCTNAMRGKLFYAVDDHTAGSSDVGGTLITGGVIIDVPASGQANFGKVLCLIGQPSLYYANPETPGTGGVSSAGRARGVVTSNVSSLASFTVAQSDLTYTAGQVALLVGQTTKTQNGPWTVGAVTTGTAPLTRPDWWAPGSVQPIAVAFRVNEGAGANSQWLIRTAGAVTVDTTAIDIDMIDGNWVQGVSTAVGTMAGQTSFFFAAALLKARLSGFFWVDLDVGWSDGTTADTVTFALVTDTSASGVLASANKVAHGVAGLGTYGTNGADWESVDTNGGASLTYNGAAWSTSAVTQASEANPTLTGLLSGSAQKFGFHGIVYNAAPTGTTKTAFTIGNTVGFGVKVTSTNTITVPTVRMSVRELPAQ